MSDDSKVDDELGFDPDSPDVSDPQVDPPKPAKEPAADRTEKSGEEDNYPPYDKGN